MVWQTKKLGDVCVVDWGNTDLTKKSYVKNGQFLAVSAAGCDGRINHKEHKKFTPVLSAIGAQCGKMFFPTEDFTAIKNTITLTPKNDCIDNKFLYYLLTFVTLPQRGAGQPFISKGDIMNFLVFLPASIDDQRRIVKILDKVVGNIANAKENTEKNLQNSKELFESYLQSLFANRGVGWEEKKLGDVCEMINRGVSPKYIERGGVCVLNQKCVRDHTINYDFSRKHDIKNKKVSFEKFIQVGDVLVNSTGVGTLGRVAQVRELALEAIVDSHITIVRPIKGKFYNDFFGYILVFIEKEIARQGAGASGQTELSREVLKNYFTVCYPESLTEQKSIVKKLDALSEQTKKLEAIYKQKLADLDELKKSVLKKAFAGEL